MTLRKRRTAAAIVFALLAVFIVAIFFGDRIRNVFAETAEQARVIYFADGNKDPNDAIPQKLGDFNFGYDRYAAAHEAVQNNEVSSELVWVFDKDNASGDLFYSIEHDPALCAAIALQIDQLGITPDNPILGPEKDLKIGERADAAHLRFLANEADWDQAVNRIKGILLGSDVQVEIRELSNYTSSMYMVCDQLEGDKPSVVVRNSNNKGGHFVIFRIKLKDGTWKELRLRLECGYQPIDTPDWPVPDIPDEPDPPTPPTPPAPKDPKDDPQNRPGAEDYDFWSPDHVNHDPDKTPTDEPVSPDEDYVPPAPPTVDPTTPPAPPTPPDYNNGGTEEHDGQDYDVETGEGDQPPLEDIADPDNPNKPEVDPALRNDPVVDREITDFE